jgi:hypothetical protein
MNWASLKVFPLPQKSSLKGGKLVMFFQHHEYPGMDVAFTYPVLMKPDGCGFFKLKIKIPEFCDRIPRAAD